MDTRQQISAAVLIAVTALTLTACSPGGIEGDGVELVEASLRGETAYDIAADLGTECEVTGSHRRAQRRRDGRRACRFRRLELCRRGARGEGVDDDIWRER